MKQKFAAYLLIGVLALSGILAGCSSSGSSNNNEASAVSESTDASETSENSSAQETESSDKESVTLIMSSLDTFLTTLEEAAVESADQYGIELTAFDAGDDANKVIEAVEVAKNNGDKAVIVNMVDPGNAEAVVEAAEDMYVVFVNRAPLEESWDDVLTLDNVYYVGSDENTSGKAQGDALSEYFTDQGKNDIKYLLIKGTDAQDATIKRTDSSLQALKDNGITAEEAAEPISAGWMRDSSKEQVSALLEDVEFDCIISNNDEMAIGAIEAMTEAEMDPSSIPIVGVDGTSDGCQAVADGEMYMTVFQNPKGQAEGALNAVIQLINGNTIDTDTAWELDETYDHILWIPFEPIYSDNVDDYM